MIYFLLPYMPFEPVGGVRTAFDYVMRINELEGKPLAKVLSDSKYLLSWLPADYSKLQIYPTTTQVTQKDTIVIPEVSIEAAKQFSKAGKKILMVLNWQYFEKNLKTYNLRKLGFTEIITNSNFSKNFVEKQKVGIPVRVIPHFIPAHIYSSLTSVDKRSKHSILILNRKNTHHIPHILEFLKDFRHTATIVNNIHPDEMAKQYGRHQIFINLGYPEGFCRPAAEAMAASCLVVGFTGGGGSDFMKHMKTAYVADDGNEKELIEQLNTVLHFSDAQRLQLSKAGRAVIVDKYTKRAQAQAIYEVFHPELTKAYTKVRIDAMYKKLEPKRTGRPTKTLKVAGPNDKSQEVLEYKLFIERMEKQELTSSKFYKLWQWYCHKRDRITRALSTFSALTRS